MSPGILFTLNFGKSLLKYQQVKTMKNHLRAQPFNFKGLFREYMKQTCQTVFIYIFSNVRNCCFSLFAR